MEMCLWNIFFISLSLDVLFLDHEPETQLITHNAYSLIEGLNKYPFE